MNVVAEFEFHSRRYIRGFIQNIFIYCTQIVFERRYFMLAQNSNDQQQQTSMGSNKSNQLFKENNNKETIIAFTNNKSINEIPIEVLKRKINSITQYQKPGPAISFF